MGISRVKSIRLFLIKIDRNLDKGRKKDMLEEIKLFSWPKMYIQFHNKILVPVLILNTFIIRILNFTFEFLLTTELLMAGPKSCIRKNFILKQPAGQESWNCQETRMLFNTFAKLINSSLIYVSNLDKFYL